MRLRNVALFSFAGMVFSSATVYSLTPPAGLHVAAGPEVVNALPGSPGSPGSPTLENLETSFDTGSTLRLGGRVGHPRMLRGSSGETFLLLETRAGDNSGTSKAKAGLSIVIDRSGSMKGDRIQNAIAGAVEAVDRLGDGDVVSVVTFDTRATTVVAPTSIDARSRESVKSEIRRIRLGGDTCISCGIEEGLRNLTSQRMAVNRMILLSDGDATDGVRDVPGFELMAERARTQGVAMTTIGVGVTYNQKIMGSIALKSGGGHYFIENAGALDRVFRAEAEKLRSSVARDAEASVELGEGVEVVRVFDRTFERRGRRVVVPLGSFARGEEKTVLIQVRVPTASAGRVPVANVSLRYDDLVEGEQGRCEGRLEVGVGAEAAPLDAVVDGRIQRDGTAAALLEANELIEQGKMEAAKKRIEAQQQVLATAAARASAAAPSARADDVDRDFKGQASALSTAAALAKPNPSSSSRALRRNQEAANPFFE